MTQLRVAGAHYFEDPWNWVDMLNIGLGYWNIYNQLYTGTLELVTKLVLIALIIVCLFEIILLHENHRELQLHCHHDPLCVL